MGKPKPYNQDAFIIHPNLQGSRGQYLFAVCDGHGMYGHDVSSFVKHTLPYSVEDCYP